MSAADERQRLFLAVWPSAGAITDLQRALAPQQQDCPTWLRWQPPERWHVTALFLGDCSARRAERVRDAAAAVAAEGFDRTPMSFTGAGRFGAVLWIGVAGAGWLAAVHDRLHRRLLAGQRVDRFRPHVTVARARGRAVPRELVDPFAHYRGPSWRGEELTLVASALGPNPRYAVIGRWPFPR